MSQKLIFNFFFKFFKHLRYKMTTAYILQGFSMSTQRDSTSFNTRAKTSRAITKLTTFPGWYCVQRSVQKRSGVEKTITQMGIQRCLRFIFSELVFRTLCGQQRSLTQSLLDLVCWTSVIVPKLRRNGLEYGLNVLAQARWVKWNDIST